jgi:hypothetical protein
MSKNVRLLSRGNGGDTPHERVEFIRVKEFDEIIKYLLRGIHLGNASMYASHRRTKSDYSEPSREASCCKSVKCFG